MASAATCADERTGDFKIVGNLSGHSGEVLAVAVSPEPQKLLLTGGEDGARLWSESDRTHVCELGGIDNDLEVVSVTFCPQKEHQVFVARSQSIFSHDIRNPSAPLVELNFNDDDINQICVNDKGTFLAAADDTGAVRVIDIATSKSYKTLSRQHENICSAVQFRPRRQWDLISGSLDSTVIHWDFSRARVIGKATMHGCAQAAETSTQMCNPPLVHSLSVSEDGAFIAAGLGDCSISICRLAGKNKSMTEHVRLHDGHSASVGQVLYPTSMASNRLFSGGNDSVLCLWDVTLSSNPDSDGPLSSSPITKWSHGRKINWMAASSTYLYVADTSKRVKIYQSTSA